MIALFFALVASASECLVLHGDGTFALPEGRRTDVALVVDGDEIAALDAPQALGLTLAGDRATWRGRDCAALDVSGQVVTPGLIAFSVRIGLSEVTAVPLTDDTTATGGDLHAAVRVGDAYDPRSTLIPVNRIRGVTSAVVAPEGGFVSGQAAFVDLAGATQAEAVVDRSAGMVVRLSGDSRAQDLLRLRTLLGDARFYSEHRAAYDAGDSRALSASREDLEALQPVLQGAMPLMVYVDQAADIEALLDALADFKVRLVLIGGAEAWMLAERLASAGVTVAVEPWVYGPGSFDQVHARADNAALLHEAGVPVVMQGGGGHWAHTLSQYAGNAVRGGLDWDAALAAITRGPAEAVGLSDVGLLAVGARANLVVWSGDPLELSSSVHHVFIAGREIELRSRHTELLERYRTLPGSPLAPLPLP